MATALSSPAKGVTTLILIQVCSKLSTFILNQALLRYLSPALLGASLRLELFSITVLFFARESLRVALQRQTSNPQSVVNVGYLAIALGLPLSATLGWQYAEASSLEVPFMQDAVAISAVANVIELLSEPSFAVVQQKLAYGIRAAAETTATILRCFVTLGVVVWYNQQREASGALPFAYGQLAYAMILTLIYYARTVPMAREEAFSMFPKAIQSPDQSEYFLCYFSRPLCALTFSLSIQSGIKYFLTQGDSILIATFASLRDQGVYGLASAYGGIGARVVFQPIEESSRNAFAKLCPSDEVRDSAGEALQSHMVDEMSESADGKTQDATTRSLGTKTPKGKPLQGRQLLVSILHLYSIVTLFAFSLGPTIAPAVLGLVAGEKWLSAGAGSVLAAYTYYIPFLAINGVTEAFVAAVASTTQLRTQSIAMAIYFVVFAMAVYYFLKIAELGAVGLVWANCVNMTCRIIWNAWFISGYFGNRSIDLDFSSMLPSSFSVASAAIAAAAVRRDSPLGHLTSIPAVDELVWPAVMTAVLGVAVLFFERGFLLDLYSTLTGQQ